MASEPQPVSVNGLRQLRQLREARCNVGEGRLTLSYALLITIIVIVIAISLL